MKDRLCDLNDVKSKVSQEEQLSKEDGENIDNGELEHLAVVFEGEAEMDDVFREAQSMHKKIAHLRMEVKRLGKQNTRFLTSVRRISSIKRDSNAIARNIKTEGEKLYARLQQMDTLCKELEEKHGAHSALVRMARSQYISLTGAFHEAMSEYNDAEMAQRENCKMRITRQAEIMGKEVTGDQIEDMIETGKWNVFSDDLVTDGRAFRSALNEIENRHKELLELESRIREVRELFFQLALLVEEQGAMVNNIEANVFATQEFIGKATTEIKKAVKYKKKHPCRQLFCCCFPCCNK
ncbi:syntaxin-11 [Astyanax mexicanus]|uniref:Syntaxin-11 n=1 Tax=Astyanax mexicanus TaxID=7994 RepID=A0A8B9RNN9_ASTMX|nr:syntaxin-11 [Astyanax mexicanus]